MREIRKKIKLFLENFREYSVEALNNGKSYIKYNNKSEPITVTEALNLLNHLLKFNAIKSIHSTNNN